MQKILQLINLVSVTYMLYIKDMVKEKMLQKCCKQNKEGYVLGHRVDEVPQIRKIGITRNTYNNTQQKLNMNHLVSAIV